MSIIVLCDGGPSSAKALDFAAFPGMLMPKHEGAQIILTHVWDRQALLSTTTPQSQQVNSPSAPGGAAASAGGGGCNELVQAATACTTPDAAVDYENTKLPSFYVLHKALHALQENKLTKDTLNFKLETSALVLPSSEAAEPAEQDAGKHGKKGGNKNSNVNNKAQANNKSPRGAPADGAASTTASPGADNHNASLNESGEPSAEQLEHAARQLRLEKASAVVQYAESRAAHHKSQLVVLGAGNSLDGKSVRVGAVAEQAVQLLGATHVLYIIKGDGFTLRPSTTIINYTILVCVGQSPEPIVVVEEEPKKSPEESVDKDGKSSKDKPSVETDALGGSTTLRPPASPSPPVDLQANSVTAVHLPPPPPVDSLAAGLAAVRYALRCRRPNSKDRVSVVLVAEPTTDESVIDVFTRAFTDILQREQPVEEEGGSEAAAGAPDQSDDKKVDADGAGETTAAIPETEVTAEHTEAEASPIVENNGDAAAVASSEPSPAVAEDQANPVSTAVVWPLVSLCTLRPTKQNAMPTVHTAAAQVTKFVQQRKTEFIVVADNTPKALQGAVLGMLKPHVVVVPHSKY